MVQGQRDPFYMTAVTTVVTSHVLGSRCRLAWQTNLAGQQLQESKVVCNNNILDVVRSDILVENKLLGMQVGPGGVACHQETGMDGEQQQA